MGKSCLSLIGVSSRRPNSMLNASILCDNNILDTSWIATQQFCGQLAAHSVRAAQTKVGHIRFKQQALTKIDTSTKIHNTLQCALKNN